LNPETGTIREYDPEELIQAKHRRQQRGLRPLIELEQLPDPDCKKCFGKGWTGRDVDTNDVIPCKCVLSKTKLELR
jgi:hypothetical protein